MNNRVLRKDNFFRQELIKVKENIIKNGLNNEYFIYSGFLIRHIIETEEINDLKIKAIENIIFFGYKNNPVLEKKDIELRKISNKIIHLIDFYVDENNKHIYVGSLANDKECREGKTHVTYNFDILEWIKSIDSILEKGGSISISKMIEIEKNKFGQIQDEISDLKNFDDITGRYVKKLDKESGKSLEKDTRLSVDILDIAGRIKQDDNDNKELLNNFEDIDIKLYSKKVKDGTPKLEEVVESNIKVKDLILDMNGMRHFKGYIYFNDKIYIHFTPMDNILYKKYKEKFYFDIQYFLKLIEKNL